MICKSLFEYLFKIKRYKYPFRIRIVLCEAKVYDFDYVGISLIKLRAGKSSDRIVL